MEMRVIAIEELDEILRFERDLLKGSIDDDFQREMAEWNAPWRREALEFYIPLGWSFAVRKDDRLVGYLMAQPFIFFRNQTQTLWVEHLQATSDEARRTLVDIAYRWARDKHLQRVLYANSDWLNGIELPTRVDFHDKIAQAKTTKS
jgi:hypothetical protein